MKYLAKIIASDKEGLQMISTCSSAAKVKISDIKYLASNKVFLLSIERIKVENENEDKPHTHKDTPHQTRYRHYTPEYLT